MGIFVLVVFVGSLWAFHASASLRPWSQHLPSRASIGFAVLLSLLPVVLLALGWNRTHQDAFRLAVMFSMSLIFVDLSLNPGSEEPETISEKIGELVTDEISEAVVLVVIGLFMVPVFIWAPSYWLYVLTGLVMAIRVTRIGYLMLNFEAAKSVGKGLPMKREEYLASQLIAIAVMIPLAFMADGLVQAADLELNNFTGFGTQSLAMLAASGLGGVATRTLLRAVVR